MDELTDNMPLCFVKKFFLIMSDALESIYTFNIKI